MDKTEKIKLIKKENPPKVPFEVYLGLVMLGVALILGAFIGMATCSAFF